MVLGNALRGWDGRRVWRLLRVCVLHMVCRKESCLLMFGDGLNTCRLMPYHYGIITSASTFCMSPTK